MKFIKFLFLIEETVLVVCMAVMGIILTLQIIMRFGFSHPLEWVEELARYLQIWITFFGVGYGLRKGSHIGMTLIKERMPALLKLVCDIIINIASIVVFIILIKGSYEFLGHQHMLSTALKIPMVYVYVSIPIGSVIYITYTVAGTFLLIGNFMNNKNKGEQAC